MHKRSVVLSIMASAALHSAAYGQAHPPGLPDSPVTFEGYAGSMGGAVRKALVQARLPIDFISLSSEAAKRIVITDVDNMPFNQWIAQITNTASAQLNFSEGKYRITPKGGAKFNQSVESERKRMLMKSIMDSGEPGRFRDLKLSLSSDPRLVFQNASVLTGTLASQFFHAAASKLVNLCETPCLGKTVTFSTHPTELQLPWPAEASGIVRDFWEAMGRYSDPAIMPQRILADARYNHSGILTVKITTEGIRDGKKEVITRISQTFSTGTTPEPDSIVIDNPAADAGASDPGRQVLRFYRGHVNDMSSHVPPELGALIQDPGHNEPAGLMIWPYLEALQKKLSRDSGHKFAVNAWVPDSGFQAVTPLAGQPAKGISLSTLITYFSRRGRMEIQIDRENHRITVKPTDPECASSLDRAELGKYIAAGKKADKGSGALWQLLQVVKGQLPGVMNPRGLLSLWSQLAGRDTYLMTQSAEPTVCLLSSVFANSPANSLDRFLHGAQQAAISPGSVAWDMVRDLYRDRVWAPPDRVDPGKNRQPLEEQWLSGTFYLSGAVLKDDEVEARKILRWSGEDGFMSRTASLIAVGSLLTQGKIDPSKVQFQVGEEAIADIKVSSADSFIFNLPPIKWPDYSGASGMFTFSQLPKILRDTIDLGRDNGLKPQRGGAVPPL